MKKLIAEFDNKITISKFDKKIDELVATFPIGASVLIKVDSLKEKQVATLQINPDQNAVERKVWDLGPGTVKNPRAHLKVVK